MSRPTKQYSCECGETNPEKFHKYPKSRCKACQAPRKRANWHKNKFNKIIPAKTKRELSADITNYMKKVYS